MVIKNKQRSITVSWLNFKLKEVDSLSIGHQKLVVCKHFNTTAFIFNTFSVTLIYFSDQICFQWSWKFRFRLVCSYDRSPAEDLRAADTGSKNRFMFTFIFPGYLNFDFHVLKITRRQNIKYCLLLIKPCDIYTKLQCMTPGYILEAAHTYSI